MPVASFTSSVNKRNVNFNATLSSSKFGTITTYAWNFGDSKTPQTTSSPLISYTYDQGGSYTVTLTITDNKGAVGTYSNTVTPVNNNLPTATITIVSIIGYLVNVEAVGADTDGVVLHYEWDWGDGEPLSDTQSASHLYKTDGTFTIGLVVID